MNIFKIIGDLLGIGKDALNNKAELKRLKAQQQHSILEAQTKAQVDRILSNTDSDNQIDLITAQDKKHTLKDEVRISYENLDCLPDWYKYVLAAIIIDVLGFRSFARKLIGKYIK